MLIYSGGQTGACQAALRAARLLQLRTTGWCTPGFRTNRGYEPRLREFGLRPASSVSAASRSNIDESDATLFFFVHKGCGGTSKELAYAYARLWKPAWTLMAFKSFDAPFITVSYKPFYIVWEHDLTDLNTTAVKVRQWLRYPFRI